MARRITVISAIVIFYSVICTDGQEKTEDVLDDDSDLNSIHKGSSKSRTFYDYQTRVVAYKDLIESRCLLEILKSGESFLGQNYQKPRLETLSKNIFMSENQLSKRQIYAIGGQRISEFCRGFPTFLIQELNDNEQDLKNNTITKDGSLRTRRETKHFFVGRVRGQTQSQYLNYGNGNDPGKAEAESTYGSSKAVVSGTSGMGQAQSQSSPDGCDGCYGQGAGQGYDQEQVLQFGRPGQVQIPSEEITLTQPPGGRGPPAQDLTRPTNGRSDRFPVGPDGRYVIQGVPGHPGQIVHPQPGQQIPGQQQPGLPGEQIPGQQLPGQQLPGQQQFGLPGGQLPYQQLPGQQQIGVPGGQIPGQQLPGQQYGLPGVQIPGQQQFGLPGGQIPRQQLPGQQLPGQQQYGLPGGHIPGQQLPGQQQFGLPGGQIPGQQLPGQQVSGQQQPSYPGKIPGQLQQPGYPGQQISGYPGQIIPGQPEGPQQRLPTQQQPGYPVQYAPGQQQPGYPGQHIPGQSQVVQQPGYPGQQIPGQLQGPEQRPPGYPGQYTPGQTIPGRQEEIISGRPAGPVGPSGHDIQVPTSPAVTSYPALYPGTYPGKLTHQEISGYPGEKRPAISQVSLTDQGIIEQGKRGSGKFGGMLSGDYNAQDGNRGRFSGVFSGEYDSHGYQKTHDAFSRPGYDTSREKPGQIGLTGGLGQPGYGGATYLPSYTQQTGVPGQTLQPGTPGYGVPGYGIVVSEPGGIPAYGTGTGGVPGYGTVSGKPGHGTVSGGQVPGYGTGTGVPLGVPGYVTGTVGAPGYGTVPGGQVGVPGYGTVSGQSGYETVPGGQIGVPGYGTVSGGSAGAQGYGPAPGVQGGVPGYGTVLGGPAGTQGYGPAPGAQRGVPGYGTVPGGPAGAQGYGPAPGVQGGVPGYGTVPGGPAGTQGYGPAPGAQGGVPGYGTVPGAPAGAPGYGLEPGGAGTVPGYGTVPGGVPGYGTLTVGVPGYGTVSGQPGYGTVPGGQVGAPGYGSIPNGQVGVPGYGTGSQDGVPGYGTVLGGQGVPGYGTSVVGPGALTGLGGEQLPGGYGQVDDSDSQVQTSVQQTNNETQAQASAQGKHAGGTAQSQVSGTYAGSGSFSASAGSDDGKRGAQVQVAGGKEGAQSSAQGRGGLGQSQAQVQLSSETGDTVSSAQTAGHNHGSQTQVQASGKGGMADAQSNAPGSTSSQAQIGFTPYDENEKEDQTSPFRGGGTAGAQSGTYTGQAQSQIQGKFIHGIRYSGAAQAGSGSRDAVALARNQSRPLGLSGAFPEFKPLTFTAESGTHPNTQNQQISHSHSKKNMHNRNTVLGSKTQEAVTDVVTNKPRDLEEPVNDYSDEEEYDYDENANTEKPQTKTVISQTSKHQNQHIVLDPVENLDATVHQSSDQFPKDGTILQPGQVIPGSPGYQIPSGFRGRVKSISYGPNTYASGTNSQAQTVTLTPGTGRIIYKKPTYAVASRTHFRNGQYGYGSGYSYQPVTYQLKSGKALPNFVSVTKSETGSTNPYTGQKTPSVYYSQSSSCGLFTNTCVFNGSGKLCFPKPKTNANGTLMSC